MAPRRLAERVGTGRGDSTAQHSTREGRRGEVRECETSSRRGADAHVDGFVPVDHVARQLELLERHCEHVALVASAVQPTRLQRKTDARQPAHTILVRMNIVLYVCIVLHM